MGLAAHQTFRFYDSWMKKPDNLANATEGPDAGKVIRETWIAPRAEARKRVKWLFEQFPSRTYLTEIESWRSCPGGSVEVIVKRLDIPIDEAD